MAVPKEIRELARKNGVTMDALYKRIERGMEPEEAASKPLKKYPKLYDQYREVAEANGVSISLFRLRRHKGMTPEQAASTPNLRKNRLKVSAGSLVTHKKETYEVKEVIDELNEIVACHVGTKEEVFLEHGSYKVIIA